MMKLRKSSFKRAKKEFLNGNNLWLAKPKKLTKLKYPDIRRSSIELVVYMGNKRMRYKQYDIVKKELVPSSWTEGKEKLTEYESWNWAYFDFFVLTKKESQRYIKKMMLGALKK